MSGAGECRAVPGAKIDPKRILFVQTAFLGDVVFSTALLRACAEFFPKAEVTLLASPRGGGILEGDAAVREVIYYDKRGNDAGMGKMLALLRRLRKERFDLVVSPHRSLRSAFIARLSGAELRLGFQSVFTRWAYNLGVSPSKGERRPYRREMELAESLCGGRRLPHRPALSPGRRQREEVRRLFTDAGLREGVPVAGLVVGTVWPTKKWPVQAYLELGRRITVSQKAQVIVLGGRGETEEAAAFDAEEGIVNLVGRTSLRQLPAILERCGVVVAGDTGPLHAAMAMAVPVVALFGPTDERQFEFGERDVCLTVEISCRPCRPHGSRTCPTGDWRCMPDIGVAAVEKAVLAAVENTGA